MSVALAQPSSYSNSIDTARHYMYVREVRPNRSYDIDRWNAYVKNALGSPYCAAFPSWCNYKGGSPVKIRTGLARNLWTKSPSNRKHSITEILSGKYVPKPGDIVVWVKGNTIQGHAGFVDRKWKKGQGWTIEANTSSGNTGSQRDGDGVYRRWRKIQPYAWFRIIGVVDND